MFFLNTNNINGPISEANQDLLEVVNNLLRKVDLLRAHPYD